MATLIKRPTQRNRHAVVVMTAVLGLISIPLLAPYAAATPPVATARSGPRYHVVQLGETLWQIAVRYDTTVGALVRANGIENPNVIFPGTRLVVPGSGSDSGGGSGTGSGGGGGSGTGQRRAGWRIHVVAAGDLLWEIAIRYDTTSAVLVRANDIPDPDALRIGMRLRVPDHGSGRQGGGGGGGTDDWGFHVVRRGELLWEIALRYGTTAGALIRANDIPDPDALRIGIRLRVPGGGSGETGGNGGGSGGGGGGRGSDAPSGWGIHVVRPGEMLWQIALRYGTTAGELIRANDIPNPDALTIGMRLRVPSGGAGPRIPSITCPVRGAQFIDDFGAPRPGGRTHEGIDLFAPRGTSVRAPASGWVAAWVGDIGGNQVRLIGDDGNYYSSSHLKAFGAGGWVEGGTVIGYVGSTGNAEGGPPHVHFEFHPKGGVAVNPYAMLVRACR